MKEFSTHMKEWLSKTAHETVARLLGVGPAMDAKYVFFADSPCNNRTAGDIVKEDSQGGKTASQVLAAGLLAVGVLDRAGGKPKKGTIVATTVPTTDGWLLTLWDGRTDTPSIHVGGIVYDDTIGP